jgi:hypothetical protein
MPAGALARREGVVDRDHAAARVQERDVERKPHAEHMDCPAGVKQESFTVREAGPSEKPPEAKPPAVGDPDPVAEEATASVRRPHPPHQPVRPSAS